MHNQTLNETEERDLLEGVREAVDCVDHRQMSPTDAMAKVARDRRWAPGMLRSAVSAYNNGRQVAQWKANDNVMDKLAAFELADYDAAFDQIWGGTEKEAADVYHRPRSVDAEYNRPPHWLPDREHEKLAGLDLTTLIGETPASDPEREYRELLDKEASDRNMRKAWSAHNMAKRAYEEARSQHAHARDLLHVRLRLLDNYFQKSALDRLPFPVVDEAVQTYYGDAGRALMDHVAAQHPREKRAADARIYWEKPLNRQAEPFTFVDNAVQAARDVHATKQALDEARQELYKAAEAMRPFVRTPVPDPLPDPRAPRSLVDGSEIRPDEEKQAGMMSFAAGGAASQGTQALLDSALGNDSSNPEAVQKQWMQLEDPDHENELRSIRVQTMLSEMLSDPESPISGHDPQEVLSAYNEIAQLAPRVAEQPAALRPLLAKKLSGNIEPFEVKEITDLEKGMRDAKNPTPQTQLLQEAPNSLLG